jgi:mRNA interferase HigB
VLLLRHGGRNKVLVSGGSLGQLGQFSAGMPAEWTRLKKSHPTVDVTILVTPCYNPKMRIISRRILREFWDKHPDAAIPLQTWFHDVERANWISPADIKTVYRNASSLANNRIVFNIKGNHYRLVVVVVYQHSVVYIRFVGTHDEYDRIDVSAI